MMRTNRLAHNFVENIPERLAPGILYIALRYNTATHLCCCGCGSEIVTPLSPVQWRLTINNETVSLYPSIGNWNLSCRSHYIIKNGQVIESEAWSQKQVAYGQLRDKQARTAYYKNMESPSQLQLSNHPPANSAKTQSWWGRLLNFFSKKH